VFVATCVSLKQLTIHDPYVSDLRHLFTQAQREMMPLVNWWCHKVARILLCLDFPAFLNHCFAHFIP